MSFFATAPAATRAVVSRAAAATTSAVIAESVAGVKGEVGVSGTVFVADIGVVTAALVGISDQDGEAGACGASVKDTGQDFRLVLFLPLCREQALSGTTSGEIRSEIIGGEVDTGRNAIDDHDVSGTVTFAGCGDAKQLTEGVTGHAFT